MDSNHKRSPHPTGFSNGTQHPPQGRAAAAEAAPPPPPTATHSNSHPWPTEAVEADAPLWHDLDTRLEQRRRGTTTSSGSAPSRSGAAASSSPPGRHRHNTALPRTSQPPFVVPPPAVTPSETGGAQSPSSLPPTSIRSAAAAGGPTGGAIAESPVSGMGSTPSDRVPFPSSSSTPPDANGGPLGNIQHGNVDRSRALLEMARQQRLLKDLQETMRRNEDEFVRRENELQHVLSSLSVGGGTAGQGAAGSNRDSPTRTAANNAAGQFTSPRPNRARAGSTAAVAAATGPTTSPRPNPFRDLNPAEQDGVLQTLQGQLERLHREFGDLDEQEAICGAAVASLIDVLQSASSRRDEVLRRVGETYDAAPTVLSTAHAVHAASFKSFEHLHPVVAQCGSSGGPEAADEATRRALSEVVSALRLPTAPLTTGQKLIMTLPVALPSRQELEHTAIATADVSAPVVATKTALGALATVLNAIQTSVESSHQYTEQVMRHVAQLTTAMQLQADQRSLMVDDAHAAITCLRDEHEQLELERDEVATMLRAVQERRSSATEEATKVSLQAQESQRRIATFQAEIEAMTQDIFHHEQQTEAQQLKVKELDAEKAQLVAHIAEADQETAKLRLEERGLHATVIAQLEGQLSTLVNKEATWRRNSELEVLKRDEAQEKHRVLHERLVKLQTDANAAVVNHRQENVSLAEAATQLRSLTRQCASLQAQLDTATTSRHQLSEAADEINEEVAKLQSEHDRLQQEFESVAADEQLLEAALHSSSASGGRGTPSAAADLHHAAHLATDSTREALLKAGISSDVLNAALGMSPPSPTPPHVAAPNNRRPSNTAVPAGIAFPARPPTPQEQAALAAVQRSRSGSAVLAVDDVPLGAAAAVQLHHDHGDGRESVTSSSASRVRRWSRSQEREAEAAAASSGASRRSGNVLILQPSSAGSGDNAASAPPPPSAEVMRHMLLPVSTARGHLAPARVFGISPERSAPLVVQMQPRQRVPPLTTTLAPRMATAPPVPVWPPPLRNGGPTTAHVHNTPTSVSQVMRTGADSHHESSSARAPVGRGVSRDLIEPSGPQPGRSDSQQPPHGRPLSGDSETVSSSGQRPLVAGAQLGGLTSVRDAGNAAVDSRGEHSAFVGRATTPLSEQERRLASYRERRTSGTSLAARAAEPPSAWLSGEQQQQRLLVEVDDKAVPADPPRRISAGWDVPPPGGAHGPNGADAIRYPRVGTVTTVSGGGPPAAQSPSRSSSVYSAPSSSIVTGAAGGAQVTQPAASQGGGNPMASIQARLQAVLARKAA